MKRNLIIGAIAGCLLMWCCKIPVYAKNSYFYGVGTKEEPYLISNAIDLSRLAELVNKEGEEFRNVWFEQTEDIDLAGIDWEPIGIYGSERYFFGIYDGNGHVLNNLTIDRDDNAGFFGQLGGICINLGIESGSIRGACTGAFSSHSASEDAIIFNCYNKAEVHGARAGGIADNFNGSIINCWSDCILEGDITGGIVSYSAIRVSNCYSTKSLFPEENSNNAEACYLVKKIASDYVCSNLNKQTFENISDILSFRNMNGWILNDEKQEMYLGDKQKFKLSWYIVANRVQIIPYMIILVVTAIILIDIFSIKRK